MTLHLNAPAKVNLYLHVTAKRDDGYHDLCTRMQKIDLCDRLQLDIMDRPGVEITCDSEDIPADDSNLAVKAAIRFFARCSNYQSTAGKGLHIGLAKAIPVGAGLGGGSSDAAAVLKGLNALFGEPLADDELMEIGSELGADVPFLVSVHGAAIATGIGDYLEGAANVDQYQYLLVNPGFPVNTKWVYENYRLTKKNKKFKICGSQNNKGGSFEATELHNDLEQVTMARYPILGQIKQTMSENGADGTLMSGSGPTVFGIFRARDRAATARSMLEQIYSKENFRLFLVDAYTGA